MLCCLCITYPFYIYLDKIVSLKYLDEHWSQHSISLSVSTAPPKDKHSNYNCKSEQTIFTESNFLQKVKQFLMLKKFNQNSFVHLAAIQNS